MSRTVEQGMRIITGIGVMIFAYVGWLIILILLRHWQTIVQYGLYAVLIVSGITLAWVIGWLIDLAFLAHYRHRNSVATSYAKELYLAKD